jgi:CHAT domain-containing protein
VSLFHYAGHGRRAGLEGFESALRLAEATRLYVGDILSLARAPARVVLSACEGARTPDQDGGLSIAHAFVAAGASAVIAATRPVEDEAAHALIAALYRQGIGALATDAAAALRSAQLAGAKLAAGSDAAGFRVLVP